MLLESERLKIRGLAEEACKQAGCRLYDLEFISGSKGRGRSLRVYVDKEGGAGIDNCADVSRKLSLLLDVEDVVGGGQYDLEVSTPGMDRVLREQWHFEQAIGQTVEIQAKKDAVVDRSRFKAKILGTELLGTEGLNLKMEVDGAEILMPYQSIEKARVVIRELFPSHPKKKTQK